MTNPFEKKLGEFEMSRPANGQEVEARFKSYSDFIDSIKLKNIFLYNALSGLTSDSIEGLENALNVNGLDWNILGKINDSEAVVRAVRFWERSEDPQRDEVFTDTLEDLP